MKELSDNISLSRRGHLGSNTHFQYWYSLNIFHTVTAHCLLRIPIKPLLYDRNRQLLRAECTWGSNQVTDRWANQILFQ